MRVPKEIEFSRRQFLGCVATFAIGSIFDKEKKPTPCPAPTSTPVFTPSPTVRPTLVETEIPEYGNENGNIEKISEGEDLRQMAGLSALCCFGVIGWAALNFTWSLFLQSERREKYYK